MAEIHKHRYWINLIATSRKCKHKGRTDTASYSKGFDCANRPFQKFHSIQFWSKTKKIDINIFQLHLTTTTLTNTSPSVCFQFESRFTCTVVSNFCINTKLWAMSIMLSRFTLIHITIVWFIMSIMAINFSIANLVVGNALLVTTTPMMLNMR